MKARVMVPHQGILKFLDLSSSSIVYEFNKLYIVFFLKTSSHYFSVNICVGASPQTGSWVPGPGSETQDPEPGTQDPISVPKVDKLF